MPYIFLISETAMLFLKPDVTKKKTIVFSLFVSLDLLFFASNLIFDLGLNVQNQVKFRRICMESSEHNWATISETICPEMQVGLLDVALFRIS